MGLSILIRGSLEEKLKWTFSLYDQDRDGFISREEMEDVVGSVYDLMGRTGDPMAEEELINERVGYIFQVRNTKILPHTLKLGCILRNPRNYVLISPSEFAFEF